MKQIKLKTYGGNLIHLKRIPKHLQAKITRCVELEEIDTIEPNLRGEGFLELFRFKIDSHIRIPANESEFNKKDFIKNTIKAINQAIDLLKEAKDEIHGGKKDE